MNKKNKNKKINSESLGTVTHAHTSNLNQSKNRAEEKYALKQISNRRIIKWSMLVFLILALLCVAVIFINQNTRQSLLNAINGNTRNASNAVVSSAQIISTKTGTGPFDSDDKPGNDSSEDNNIVRSFDQVTWTVDLTMNSKDNKAIAGSKINIEATLPERCSNVMKWDLDSIQWMENGQLSEDGRTLTGSYTVADTESSSSAKQTLVFVLQVYGAGNGTEIQPIFNFNIDGNKDTEKTTITGEKITVSAAGNYNIKLARNNYCNNRATGLNYNGQSIDGRVYGYAFILQLYNDNSSKGLKGLEYPQGEITFDIDLHLFSMPLGSSDISKVQDITNRVTPILWNYKVNNGIPVIPDRSMNFASRGENAENVAPLGTNNSDRNKTVYNSGNITMEQQGGTLKVTVKDYDFDGIFPKYNNRYISSSAIEYTDNIGCFSVGYFQVIVPDDETLTENMDYYLAVSDTNFNIETISEDKINSQKVTTDDSDVVQYIKYNKGLFSTRLYLYGEETPSGSIVGLPSEWNSGDAMGAIGQTIAIQSEICINPINEANDLIKSVDNFIKFDGDAFEPTTYDDIDFYPVGMDNMKFKRWFVTKKDGSNWTSQENMNNGKIEDMVLYENKDDIPEGYTCIGIYIESQGGYLPVPKNTDTQYFLIPLKIKDTAKIGTTYGITSTMKLWREELDRTTYTQEKLDSYDTYPETAWDSGNPNYIKTEYDENGTIVPGTHTGGSSTGNTVLVVGANLHGTILTGDSSFNSKVNYDLGKNENTVTYGIMPFIDTNEALKTQISNITLKAEVTLPKGVTYKPGSSLRAKYNNSGITGVESFREPEIIQNDDGSTTLVWYLYNCTSGEVIDAIGFNANIDNETANGTQYEAKFVVSEVIGEDGVSKIGNSTISRRTSTAAINIINLESHRLYKEVETPIIEKNGDITYKITYENKTDSTVPDFQLLDILPYNGDNRGSTFSGNYRLKNVNVTQTVNGSVQGSGNLSVYTTNSDDVRKMDAKNAATYNIWEQISTGNVNKESKGIAVKGQLAGKTKVEVEITLQTNGNNSEDVYSNSAMAQVYSNSDQMVSSTVNSTVVNRYIEGKVWLDSNYNGVIDDEEKYLNGVTLNLINTADSSQVATTTTNENGEYKFTDVAKGKYKVQIVVDGTYYDLTEKKVGTNVEINSKFSQDTKETDEITRLNNLQSPKLSETNVNAGLTIKKIDIPVTKVWSDNENESGKRPNSVKVVLNNGISDVESQVLNDSNNWSYTFENLPKYDTESNAINYTVKEQEVTSGDLYFYDTNVSGRVGEGFTITNTFSVPDEKVNVDVSKVWIDTVEQQDKRSTDVTVILKANGETVEGKTLDLNTANSWKGTFTDLAKYDSLGNEINYTVEEKDLGNIFYKKENSSVSGDMESGYTITNKFAVPTETINIPVVKVWEDKGNVAGKRPASIDLVLTGNDGKQYRHTLTTENVDSTDANRWLYTFTGLPKYNSVNGDEIVYTLSEENVNSDFYVASVDPNSKTVTNTFRVPYRTINIPVTKMWDDSNNANGRRPESITITLTGKGQGVNIYKEQVLTKDNTAVGNNNAWQYRFDNLPTYDDYGDEIVYTINEKDTGNEFYIKTDVDQATRTVTNKFQVPGDKVDVPVTKVWDDNENAAGKRPSEVTLLLTSNDTTDVNSPYKVTLNSTNADSQDNNKWKYTFENLPKYNSVNGDEIVYTLSEELNNIYYTSVNSKVDQVSKTITNKFVVPNDTIDVPVAKVWNDNGNVAGKRSDSVTLVLTGNDLNDRNNPYKHTLTAENVDSTDSNKWKYTFTGLPKYNSLNGDEITYTLSEENINNKFYTASVDDNSKTVTNTFSVPNEKTSVTVTKIWDDKDNLAGKRPTSVTMKVTGTGEGVNSNYEQQITAEANADPSNANHWVYTFNDLPKLDNYGNEIKYTVDEEDLGNKFYTKGSIDQTAMTVTNVSKYGKVIVHYYIEEPDGTKTEIKVPDINGQEVQDVTIEGAQGDNYTTNPAENVQQNYELVETPANSNGTITEQDTEVIYYYKLKTPTVINTVTKTGTDKITSASQEVNYTITYTANVTDYIGNAEVTIIDTLPYALNTSRQNELDGGTYNETDRTITWKENVSDIDSFNNKEIVTITKNIKVYFNGLDMNQDKITNNVKGQIKLLTPEKTSEETTNDFETPIYKAIISAEKLVDKTEAIEGEKVTYTVRIKNDGNLDKTVMIADTLPEGLRFDSNTQITIGNMGTVYTEQNLKNGIQIEVPEFSTVDVTFAGIVEDLPEDEYSKELKNKATIDNEPTNEVTTEVTKANISAHKESEPASGSKVREGDTITYRIRVRNDGTRAGAVLVKDTIPTGTTFVEGSIKIGDLQDLTKTAIDLQNGISVDLGINEEKVVEFKVTVNKLVDGTKIKNVAYTTEVGEDGTPTEEDKKVPEEPEHTYVEPKEEQEISKAGTSAIDSLNDEITYNINYKAEIADYEGNATAVLVDQLPYAIDEGKSDLNGGTYDSSTNTITWKEPIENIQMTESREVNISKTIKVVYIGINQETLSIKNIVKGHIDYETPEGTSEEVEANWTTTTGFTVNIPVSKVWEDSDNKLGQRPTRVIFKLTGSDGKEYTKVMARPGIENTTTTQDSNNPNKWNDIFTDLPKYDSSNNEIIYTLTEEENTEGDLKYYDSLVTDKTVTNTNKYGKVTVHHYIINPDGTTTTNRVPDTNGTEIPDEVIEGKEGDPYETKPAENINEKYELVEEKLPENPDGTIEKYNEEKPQEVIYYYRLKPAKVIIHYLEKDTNQVLTNDEQIDGHVDDKYNTNEAHKKDTIEKDGKKYTLVSDSGNTEGTMTVADTNVTYYYLQNTKATVRYVARDPETHKEIKDLESPTTKEGLVGDEFVTNSKDFLGYKLVESPEHTTIKMTKEEQTLIYYYEPVYTGLLENHIDDKTGKILYTEEHEVQVGDRYNIPSKEFEGYDLVTTKLPTNAEGTKGEELVTVNYYYIKKAVLEVHYVDIYTKEPLTEKIVDSTKYEGDLYTTEQKEFDNYDLVELPANKDGTIQVETDESGNITNNKTIVIYYYSQRAVVEEHHIDNLTGKDIEEPTIHNGHVGDEYDIPSKEFLSYQLIEEDEEGNSKLPANSKGTMAAKKIVVNYYYNQPAKVIVHYVEKATGKELEELNEETGELQSSQVLIEGFNQDEYTTDAKEFKYYTLIESPENKEGKMNVEIVEDEEKNKTVNNTIDVYYYYQAKPFNVGVEKEITGIVVNGETRTPTNGRLERVEIYRKDVEKTNVQIMYKIRVINSGEVEGAVTIEDKIPEGMSVANNDGTWEEKDGVLRKIIEEINPGEIKEYTVVLNWNTAENNMGEKDNVVSIVDTQNIPGFTDNNDKDNTSNANVIMAVETGEIPIGLIIALAGLVALEGITLRYAVVLTKKQKKSNKK